MSFADKLDKLSQKGRERIKRMALFQRPSSKRRNSRNLIKRYCRLIK